MTCMIRLAVRCGNGQLTHVRVLMPQEVALVERDGAREGEEGADQAAEHVGAGAPKPPRVQGRKRDGAVLLMWAS